jgi:hypothetical protein
MKIGTGIGINFYKRLNLQTVGSELEFKAPGNTGHNQEGNWKFIVNGSFKIDLQKYKSGAWETVKEDYF